MQIQAIKIATLKVPLNRTFKTAIRTTDFLEDLLVTIEADGITGYGSAPATTAITGDTIEGMQAVMHNIVIPNLIGLDPLDRLTAQQKVFKKFAGNFGVRMAVDMALFDIAAKKAGMPLYQYLGGAKQKLLTDVTISCGDVAEVAKQTQDALAKGFKILKIKLGNDVQQDIAICTALAASLPADCLIRIDANQGWTLNETLYFLEKISALALNIDCIEQPVAADNITAMSIITAKSPWPIMADESVFNSSDAVRVLQHKAAHFINIKLAKSGGITQAIKIKHLADTYHTDCMIGCMMESPLGIAAAAHFAAAMGLTKIDLDPLDWVDASLYQHWLSFKNGVIELGDQPGIGFSV